MRSKSKHRDTYPAPLILPAEKKDVPRLVEIYILAEANNLILLVDNISLSRVKQWLIDLLEQQLDGPQLRLMKAVDRESGEIAALGFWWLRGWGLEDKRDERMVSGFHREVPNFVDERASPCFSSPLRNSNTFPAQFSSNNSRPPKTPLQTHLSKSFKDFEESWITKTKCMNLSMLMTDPKFQRRGIGTALLEWGHEMADREGVPCFLIASPVGYPLYAHVGWKEVGVMEVDLKDWAEYGKSGDMGWGTYKFYYMLRLPKDAKS